jgi:chemotaxis protein methyltransferase CheR
VALQISDALVPGGGEPNYDPELERIEIELLLEGIFRNYGFDFRAYAYASIRRRLWKRIEAEGLSTVSELQARVLHEPQLMESCCSTCR